MEVFSLRLKDGGLNVFTDDKEQNGIKSNFWNILIVKRITRCEKLAHKIEAILDYLKTRFDSEPKPRLHIGEAMGCWTYYTALAEEIPVLEMALNTTTDNVLLKLIKEAKELAVEQRDILEEFMRALEGDPTIQDDGFCIVPVTHNIKLGELAYLIQSFKESRSNLSIPKMEDALTKKLYSTYLSFLPENQFSYDLKMNCDHRGSFTEFMRTPERGQVSVNVSKPGITKGNHWHHTKNEKFLVVSGEGLIRFRKIDSDEIIEYRVSGEKLQVVDIPTGYTHSIVNVGESDLVTVMWANECFDPEKPDTYFMEV